MTTENTQRVEDSQIVQFDAEKMATDIDNGHESILTNFENEVKGLQNPEIAKLRKTLSGVNTKHQDKLFKLRFIEGKSFKDTQIEKHGLDLARCGTEQVKVQNKETLEWEFETRYFNESGITRLDMSKQTCERISNSRGTPVHATKMVELHEKMLLVQTSKMGVMSLKPTEPSYVGERAKLTEAEVDLERFELELGITPEKKLRFGGIMETYKRILLEDNAAKQKHVTARINMNKAKLDVITKVQKNFAVSELQTKLMNDMQAGDAKLLVGE